MLPCTPATNRPPHSESPEQLARANSAVIERTYIFGQDTHRISGDKGYSSRAIREYARRRGIRITIPRRRNERRTGPFDKGIYRLRNRVERLINRMKQFRRLATRYEKLGDSFRTMWVIAATVLWL